jgi:hypothetical protein
MLLAHVARRTRSNQQMPDEHCANMVQLGRPSRGAGRALSRLRLSRLVFEPR